MERRMRGHAVAAPLRRGRVGGVGWGDATSWRMVDEGRAGGWLTKPSWLNFLSRSPISPLSAVAGVAMAGVSPSDLPPSPHPLSGREIERYVCGWATGRSRTRFCSSGWSPTPARPGPWARRRRRGERQPPRRPRSAWGAASPMGTSSSSCPENFCGEKWKRPAHFFCGQKSGQKWKRLEKASCPNEL